MPLSIGLHRISRSRSPTHYPSSAHIHHVPKPGFRDVGTDARICVVVSVTDGLVEYDGGLDSKFCVATSFRCHL